MYSVFSMAKNHLNLSVHLLRYQFYDYQVSVIWWNYLYLCISHHHLHQSSKLPSWILSYNFISSIHHKWLIDTKTFLALLFFELMLLWSECHSICINRNHSLFFIFIICKTKTQSPIVVWKMKAPEKKPLVRPEKPEEVRAKVRKGSQKKVQNPIHALSEFQSPNDAVWMRLKSND